MHVCHSGRPDADPAGESFFPKPPLKLSFGQCGSNSQNTERELGNAGGCVGHIALLISGDRHYRSRQQHIARHPEASLPPAALVLSFTRLISRAYCRLLRVQCRRVCRGISSRRDETLEALPFNLSRPSEGVFCRELHDPRIVDR